MANKCEHCLRKTHFTVQCKCGKHFCINHRDPGDHTCSFNHQEAFKKYLQQNNPVVQTCKFTKI